MSLNHTHSHLSANRAVYIGLIIFLLAFSIRIGYFGIFGIQPASDTEFYLRNSTIVQEARGNVLALREAGVPIYYWGFSSLLAVLQNNQTLVVLLQIVLHAFAAVLMYKIGKRIFGFTAGIIAGVGFAFLQEVFHWNLYVLTDSLFVFILIASLYAYLRASETQNVWRWTIFGLLIVSTIFIRPAFAPLFGSVALLLIAGWNRKLRWSLIGTMGLIGIGGIIYFFQQSPDVRHGVSGFLHFFLSLYEDGIIVRSRYETDGGPLWVFIRRLVAFWYIYAGTYSLTHTFLNIAMLVPLFLFGILGIVRAFKDSMTPVHYFIFNTIVLYWIFHSATNLDYDWRYRITTLPFLLLFASYGIASSIPQIRRIIRIP